MSYLEGRWRGLFLTTVMQSGQDPRACDWVKETNVSILIHSKKSQFSNGLGGVVDGKDSQLMLSQEIDERWWAVGDRWICFEFQTINGNTSLPTIYQQTGHTVLFDLIQAHIVDEFIRWYSLVCSAGHHLGSACLRACRIVSLILFFLERGHFYWLKKNLCRSELTVWYAIYNFISHGTISMNFTSL